MSQCSFRLKWVHSGCQLSPTFLSSDKLCFSCDNFIRICDTDAKKHASFPLPGKGISCLATIPDMGIIGIAEKCHRPKIFVVKYPSFRVASVISYGSKSAYVALAFVGLDYLVTVCEKPDNDIVLWNWKRGQRIHSTLQRCTYLTECTYRLTSNPSSWFQLCLQQTTSLTIIEIKGSDQQMSIHQKCLVSPEEGQKSFCIQDKRHTSVIKLATENGKMKRIAIIAHCWVPDGNIIAACKDGTVMIVDVIDLSISILYCFESGAVTSLAYNGSGLFVGKEDGYVFWIDISQHRWKLLEKLNIGQTIADLSFCPNYETLSMVSVQGSVFVYKTGGENVRCIVSGDRTAIVGIFMIHPESRNSITIRSNGLMQVWCMSTGRFVSKAHIDDNVVSMAGSPLCPVIILSTVSGYVYFLDATNIHRIRTVNVIKPCDTPVEHIRFDNFGRYVLLTCGKDVLFIFNGLPSSSFRFLGSLEPSGYVQDAAVFAGSENATTYVLLLSNCGSCLREGVGDTIEMIELPNDLQIDPTKYQNDVFGMLSADSTKVRKWVLEVPGSKILAHSGLGAILYSPLSNEIQAINLWAENSNTSTTPISLQKIHSENKISDFIVSSDHRYLIYISQCSTVYILNLWNVEEMPISSDTFGKAESNYNIAFSELVGSVVIGSENGIVACYEFDILWILETVVPEWILKCSENSGVESLALSEMEEGAVKETSKKKRLQKTLDKPTEELPNAKQDFDKKLKDIGISLQYLVHKAVYDSDNEVVPSHDFHLHDDDVLQLYDRNEKRLKEVSKRSYCENVTGQSKEILLPEEKTKKLLSGIKSSLEVSNYTNLGENADFKQYMNRLQEQKQNSKDGTKYLPEIVWGDSSNIDEDIPDTMLQRMKLIYVSSDSFMLNRSELKEEKQKMDYISLLKEVTYKLKEEFNKQFEAASEFKHKEVLSIREKVAKVKEHATHLNVNEPFWQVETGTDELTILEERGILEQTITQKQTDEHDGKQQLLTEEESQRLPKELGFMSQKPSHLWNEVEQTTAKKFELKRREATKSNVEKEFAFLKQSIHESIMKIDKACNCMYELKLVCNFMIYEVEIKIFILLLWMLMASALKLWMRHYEEEITNMKSLRKPLKAATETIKTLKQAAEEFHDTLLKLERKMDIEAQQQCQKFESHSEELYNCFRRRPSMNAILKLRGRNPFRPCSPRPVSREDLELSLQTLNSKSNCPDGVNRNTWESICHLRMWKFAAEEVLRTQTLHVLGINKFLLQWKTLEQELRNETKSMSTTLEKIKYVLVKCNDTASALLGDKTRNSDIDLVLLTEHSVLQESEQKPDTRPMTIWRAIRRGTNKNKRLQVALETIEKKCEELRHFYKGGGKLTGAKELSSKMDKLNAETRCLEENFKENQVLMRKIQHSLLAQHN